MTKYNYLVLTQEDFFKSQVIEEVLRERITHLLNERKPVDFWIVTSPLFCESKEFQEKLVQTQFYKQHKDTLIKDNFYCIMLVSTNIEYFKWLKLRLGYFEEFESSNLKNNNFQFKSDGIFGIFEEDKLQKNQLLESRKLALHPKVRLEKLNEIFTN